jgi:hypothetical protein
LHPTTHSNRTTHPTRAAHALDSAAVLLAAHRLLDSMQARPRSRAQFEDAKMLAAHSVRAALDHPPAHGASRGWLRVARRLSRALRSETSDKTRGLRLAADLICIPRLCERTACRKAQRCHGAARACLARSAQRVPDSLRRAIEALTERLERGDRLELAVALMPFESKMTLWAWQRAQTRRHAGGKDHHDREKAGHDEM